MALSGGGARGAAHVGVLKALEEMRIPIDYIAGTSMGSIVGALYASGMTPAEIEQALKDVDWDGVFHDTTDRQDRSFRRKQDDRTFLVQHKPGLKNGKVKLPMALVEGQKFDLVLRKLLLPVSDVRDFDDLRIPYRAVATDIATGHAVVLGKGDLALAARASMAVPGAFAAVDIDGKTLVDGGMANNLPISVVRQMGADIVIAVDISTPLLRREEIGSVLGVVEQLTGFLTRGNTEAQIASLTGRDLLIVPPLDGAKITSGDFKRAGEAVTIGEQATRAKRNQLAKLRIAQPAYARYQQAHPNPREGMAPSQPIEFVEIENNSAVSKEVIAAHLGIRPGDPVDIQRIEAGIARLYGLDHFEKVGYTLEKRNGKHGIRFRVQEKSWGTDSLQLGMELFTSSNGGSAFNLGGAITFTPFGPNAGEWRSLFSVGEEDKLITEVYYPLDPAHRWFIGGDLGYQSSMFRLFNDGQALAEYETSGFVGRLRFGHNLDAWGRLQVQLERGAGDAEVRTGPPTLPDMDFETGKLSLTAAVDTLDNLYFPREGIQGNLTWLSSLEDLGADTEYDQLFFNLNSATSWGDHSAQAAVTFATTIDENAPIDGLFRLGGPMRLSGLEMNAMSGQHAALLRGMYRYRLNDVLVPLYAGATLELGNTWFNRDDISVDNSLWGGNLFLAADTPLGPAFLGYGYTEGDHNALFLTLGSPWH